MSDYTSVPHAAQRLDVNAITIRRWIRRGLLRAYQPTMRVVRVRKSEVEKFMVKNSSQEEA